VLVHNAGQRHLPIHIFPSRLTDDGFKALAATHQNDPVLLGFWRNLKQGHDLFEKSHRLPSIKTRADGVLLFTEAVPPAHYR
jgi:murein L,D-transpeptidase YafK